MTEERTIRQLVLEFAGDVNLGELDDLATQVMGFTKKNIITFGGKRNLHEFSHLFEAIFRSEGDEINLQRPNYSRELGAIIINDALCLKENVCYQSITEYKDFFTAISRTLSAEKEHLISTYPEENEPHIYRFLDQFITNKEIEERIKLALIMRGRIFSSQEKEWAKMDLEKEQSNLKISEILPDITVSELEKIPPQFLLDYARDGVGIAIKKAVDSGLDQKVVETMAQQIDEVAYALYKKGKPNGAIESPQIQTGGNPASL
jgi:hypothetical protein